ncbi:single-stranded DNA-binding protein [Streptomyces sp. NPDC052496]|uniref:single-stranded DNA-binding protein n=1 Tax=Streptomyces sp. NPDC052496 TaxID=3154951 RepID=UPI0034490B47
MAMYETMVTLVGNAATAVEHRQTTTGVSAVRFRLATSARRWDKERGCWVDGDTSFYTVRAWRSLADHVAASVSRGEPLVVHGRMRVWERELPEDKAGSDGQGGPGGVNGRGEEGGPGGANGQRNQGAQRRVSVEVDAVAVGHDLSRGTSAFRRISRMSTDSAPPPAARRDGPEAPTPITTPTTPTTLTTSATPETPATSPAPAPAPAPAPVSVPGPEPDWASPPPTATREVAAIAAT